LSEFKWIVLFNESTSLPKVLPQSFELISILYATERGTLIQKNYAPAFIDLLSILPAHGVYTKISLSVCLVEVALFSKLPSFCLIGDRLKNNLQK